MAVTRRTIGATVGDCYVEINTFANDGRMTMTVNGATIQFPMSAYGKANAQSDNDDTIQALKEAVNAL